MLTDFQNSFSGRLSSKFLPKQQLKIPPYLKRVASLPCEIFVLKNRHELELSTANSRARLNHSQQLLKNIHRVMSASFCSLTKHVYRGGHIDKRTQNARLYGTHIRQLRRKTSRQNALAPTTFSHWWHQSASNNCSWHYTSLILADHGVKVSKQY